ncbi:hemicentin-1-like [Ostrinia nubilalis]|uniref:hemicentin-1-like n=1 Tax=Ostrinia nubilalis TaxID=29057 RepID=UPI0030824A27
MISKCFVIYFALFALKFVSGKSFTIVLDTTDSMQVEIDIIKINIASVVDVMKNMPDFNDFIIVPFNDPDIGPPLTSTNPDDMVDIFHSISARGGNQCPEDSLAGIHKALEISRPNSFVYVFTDAFAKDITRLKDIQNLCKTTQSQVVIFLSGSCSGSEPRTQGYADVYYDIARSCSGAVFKFDSVNLRKAFNYVKEMIRTDWNDVINHEPFTGYKQFTVNVDAYTSDFLIAISGDYPTLQVVDSEHKNPVLQKIVDTKQSLVVRLADLRPGEYQISVRCQGLTSLTFYKKSKVPYQYGFSTRIPNSLQETTTRPMPGRQNYILIVAPKAYNFRITSIELQMTDSNEKKLLTIEESQIREGYYLTNVFVENSSFKMLIHGTDASFKEMTTTSKVIEVQAQVRSPVWSKPVVEILEVENNLINFGTNATIVCKVVGYPKPEIVWVDNEESKYTTEELLLEMPSVYLSYVTVNVTKNHTMYCKVKNTDGKDEKFIDLYANRTFTFNVLQTPQNETFQYGSEGKLYCEVDAYPEAEIKWTHNDTSVDYSDNLEVVKDENALVIKNMTLNDVGLYECKASNEIESKIFKAEVTVSGLEAPELDVDNYEVDLKPGDFFDTECRVIRGNPPPKISWEYKIPNEYDFVRVPSDVYVDGAKLKISVVSKEHRGTYRCVATNMFGEAFKEISVNIKYAPIISSSDEGTVVVKEGDSVDLPCKVDAEPEASVHWEFTQGGVVVPMDDRHTFDDHYTHRFSALWKDSGEYRCVAENLVGKTEKTVAVNVLVAPYIQPPEAREVTVTPGSNINLSCKVLYGNPEPTTRWEFTAPDSKTTVISRGNTTNPHNLYLGNLSRANEGMYLCIADNEVGNDRIRMYLKVY